MGDSDSSTSKGRSTSYPKMIPETQHKPDSLRIDYTGQQSASFVSQRSSSVESSETPPFDGTGNYLDQQTDTIVMSGGVEATSDESTLENSDKSALAGGGDGASSSGKWTSNDTLPSSLRQPDHQSTPVRFHASSLPELTVMESGATSMECSTQVQREGEDDDADSDRVIFLPGDLSAPITGFETMESRSKFTVYKIHVQMKAKEEAESSWFVFRRYSDFAHLNDRLKYQFPHFRLSLPPKRWFRDNFDRNFLEDRVLGLQAFLDNITGHKDLCNSEAVRGFFCTDEPPGPHDSLEESRALCESLEESMYSLRQEIQEKDREVALLKEEVDLYKSQVQLLTNQLKVLNSKPLNPNITSPSSTPPSPTERKNSTTAEHKDRTATGETEKAESDLKEAANSDNKETAKTED